jgi:hypothetical protein
MSSLAILASNRPLAAFVLLLFCLSAGCSNVQTVGIDPLSPGEAESLVGKRVRLHTDDGVKTVTIADVDYPYAVCTHTERSRSYKPTKTDKPVATRIDLREVQKIEIVEPSSGKTFLLTITLVTVGFVSFWAKVIATEGLYEM